MSVPGITRSSPSLAAHSGLVYGGVPSACSAGSSSATTSSPALRNQRNHADGVNLHAGEFARVVGAEAGVGPGRDADVLRRLEPRVGEGREGAAREVVVGEEQDGVMREPPPGDQPLHGGAPRALDADQLPLRKVGPEQGPPRVEAGSPEQRRRVAQEVVPAEVHYARDAGGLAGLREVRHGQLVVEAREAGGPARRGGALGDGHERHLERREVAEDRGVFVEDGHEVGGAGERGVEEREVALAAAALDGGAREEVSGPVQAGAEGFAENRLEEAEVLLRADEDHVAAPAFRARVADSRARPDMGGDVAFGGEAGEGVLGDDPAHAQQRHELVGGGEDVAGRIVAAHDRLAQPVRHLVEQGARVIAVHREWKLAWFGGHIPILVKHDTNYTNLCQHFFPLRIAPPIPCGGFVVVPPAGARPVESIKNVTEIIRAFHGA